MANAFGVLVMVLIEIPLGIKTKRANTAFNTVIGFAVCVHFVLFRDGIIFVARR